MSYRKENITIVIPVYKNKPTFEESISLIQCAKVLGSYEIIFIAPDLLNIAPYSCLVKGSKISVIYFNPYFFNSLENYNNLLMSVNFYSFFSNYDYILVHQLDVFVFRDELEYWCKKNYDFIGSPWLDAPWFIKTFKSINLKNINKKPFYKKVLNRIVSRIFISNYMKFNVGNGGFSLRKVSSFLKIASSLNSEISCWQYNEDVFWGVFVPLYDKSFVVPSWRTAIFFGFDFNPNLAIKYLSGNLPFGAHAWYRSDFPYEGNFEFWKNKVKDYGYVLDNQEDK